MTDRVREAIRAIVALVDDVSVQGCWSGMTIEQDLAITALRARLAEPEPVGTCGRRTEGGEMTRDEIMELAQGTAGQHWMDEAHIQRFASALIAAEREAILRHAQPAHDVDGHCEIVTVTAIRARGEK